MAALQTKMPTRPKTTPRATYPTWPRRRTALKVVGLIRPVSRCFSKSVLSPRTVRPIAIAMTTRPATKTMVCPPGHFRTVAVMSALVLPPEDPAVTVRKARTPMRAALLKASLLAAWCAAPRALVAPGVRLVVMASPRGRACHGSTPRSARRSLGSTGDHAPEHTAGRGRARCRGPARRLRCGAGGVGSRGASGASVRGIDPQPRAGHRAAQPRHRLDGRRGDPDGRAGRAGRPAAGGAPGHLEAARRPLPAQRPRGRPRRLPLLPHRPGPDRGRLRHRV